MIILFFYELVNIYLFPFVNYLTHAIRTSIGTKLGLPSFENCNLERINSKELEIN